MAAPASKSEFITVTREEALVLERRDDGKHLYITGLRGILVIESIIWVYLQTYIPSVVSPTTSRAQTAGPAYQTVIRDIFSALLWNDSLIYNAFILLSMRTIAVSYLQNPSGQTYAATVIRRIVRMVVILSAASGIATLIYSQVGTSLVQDFIVALPNDSIVAPEKTYNALSAFNSLFNLFWLTNDFYEQAANSFWPTHTLWVPAVIYYQVSALHEICAVTNISSVLDHLLPNGVSAFHSAEVAFARPCFVCSWRLLDGVMGMVQRNRLILC